MDNMQAGTETYIELKTIHLLSLYLHNISQKLKTGHKLELTNIFTVTPTKIIYNNIQYKYQ